MITLTRADDWFRYRVARYDVYQDGVFAGKIETRKGEWFYLLTEHGGGYEPSFTKAKKTVTRILEGEQV
jgi:hypothetical protein